MERIACWVLLRVSLDLRSVSCYRFCSWSLKGRGKREVSLRSQIVKLRKMKTHIEVEEQRMSFHSLVAVAVDRIHLVHTHSTAHLDAVLERKVNHSLDLEDNFVKDTQF